jgi:hypothetical protein
MRYLIFNCCFFFKVYVSYNLFQMRKYDNILARCHNDLTTTVWLTCMYMRCVSDCGAAHWITEAAGVPRKEWAPRNLECLNDIVLKLAASVSSSIKSTEMELLEMNAKNTILSTQGLLPPISFILQGDAWQVRAWQIIMKHPRQDQVALLNIPLLSVDEGYELVSFDCASRAFVYFG